MNSGRAEAIVEVYHEPAITPPAARIFTRSTHTKMPATITVDSGDCESVDGKKEKDVSGIGHFY